MGIHAFPYPGSPVRTTRAMDNSSESGVTGCRISDATRRRENVRVVVAVTEREREIYSEKVREVLKKCGGRELRE